MVVDGVVVVVEVDKKGCLEGGVGMFRVVRGVG